jgi:hypothetical protein
MTVWGAVWATAGAGKAALAEKRKRERLATVKRGMFIPPEEEVKGMHILRRRECAVQREHSFGTRPSSRREFR